MRLKNGFQQCPRCHGRGCWRCHQKGYLIQCPTCGIAELELMAANEDGSYKCLACGTMFSKSGDVLESS